VSVSRTLVPRLALLVFVAGAAVSLAALQAPPPPTEPVRSAADPTPAATLPDTLEFEVEYAGVGAEGVDLLWRGFVRGPVPGQLTLRMEYAGNDLDRAMPVWPVNAMLFFSADDYRSSFIAELAGSVSWRSREMRLTGMVTDGRPLDAGVEQRVRLHRPGLSGDATLVFLPRLAMRARFETGSRTLPHVPYHHPSQEN
jgi:hypothetical protein